MKKNSFLNDILQNTSCPQGFWGRMILRGMNCFHASLAHRGMKQVDWRPEWNVLDIGCGGGANVKRLLKLCPQGKVYGMDLSEESVAFARRHNAENWTADVSYSRAMSAPCLTGTGPSMPLRPSRPSISGLPSARRWPKSPRDPEGGCFLISLEASDPELGKAWTERIKGMTVYGAEELKQLLSQAGFSDIRVIQKKEELHIVAHK